MKEKFKQWTYRMIEFRYYLKYRKCIPKGVLRAMIEMTIFLGQLSRMHKYGTLDDNKVVDTAFNGAIKKYDYIGEYIDYLRESRKNTN